MQPKLIKVTLTLCAAPGHSGNHYCIVKLTNAVKLTQLAAGPYVIGDMISEEQASALNTLDGVEVTIIS